MKLLYNIVLQWKISLRNKEMLVTYYIVPLAFHIFMSLIFTSIMPGAEETLIQAMIGFGVTMGGVLGSPAALVEVYGSEIKKSYRAGNIPLWTAVVSNVVSGFVHLFLMSMVIFVTAPLLFKAASPQSLPAFFLGLGLFILASLMIGTLFGLFVKSNSKLGMVTQVVFLPSVMLSGIMFPSSMLPSILEMAGKVFPAYWGFVAMCDSTIVISNLLPMLAIILVAGVIAAIRLKQLNQE